VQVLSDRFEVGRNFCNKLWNAARFVLMNLGDQGFRPLSKDEVEDEDRWILSRLSRAVNVISEQLSRYHPSSALAAARDFFWGDFCDWYLELIKPRMRDGRKAAIARLVLAAVLDQILRLLHPFIPFITEQLWSYLNERAPKRGIREELPASRLLVSAAWPSSWDEWEDAGLEEDFSRLMNAISCFRELRSRHRVPPGKLLPAAIKTSGDALSPLKAHSSLIVFMARLSDIRLGESIEKPANAATQVADDIEVFLGGVLNPQRERTRLEGQKTKVEKQLEASSRKLANEGFIRKAPSRVVEAERERETELKSQLAALDKSLEALRG
jgi:valyl-tRNA synthetase